MSLHTSTRPQDPKARIYHITAICFDTLYKPGSASEACLDLRVKSVKMWTVIMTCNLGMPGPKFVEINAIHDDYESIRN